jgi:hypothetical protein
MSSALFMGSWFEICPFQSDLEHVAGSGMEIDLKRP